MMTKPKNRIPMLLLAAMALTTAPVTAQFTLSGNYERGRNYATGKEPRFPTTQRPRFLYRNGQGLAQVTAHTA
jgi:hypothetical protein